MDCPGAESHLPDGLMGVPDWGLWVTVVLPKVSQNLMGVPD